MIGPRFVVRQVAGGWVIFDRSDAMIVERHATRREARAKASELNNLGGEWGGDAA